MHKSTNRIYFVIYHTLDEPKPFHFGNESLRGCRRVRE